MRPAPAASYGPPSTATRLKAMTLMISVVSCIATVYMNNVDLQSNHVAVRRLSSTAPARLLVVNVSTQPGAKQIDFTTAVPPPPPLDDGTVARDADSASSANADMIPDLDFIVPEAEAHQRQIASERTLPTSVPTQSHVTNPPIAERAVIALISHGWTAKGYEDNTTIKGSKRSIDLALRGLLQHVTSKCTIHFYFVTGAEDAVRVRSNVMSHIHRAPTNITYSMVPLPESNLSMWMDFIGHTPTHRTGAAGNIKLFYPLLFPHEERILMLDTDVIIAKDICGLWHHFTYFGEEQLFAFSPQANPMSYTKDNQFNAGVGLLHLGRMRSFGVLPAPANKTELNDREAARLRFGAGYLWLLLARNAISNWHQKGMLPKCCAHGDQSIYHMIRFLHPATLTYYLPRWWNINKCHHYQHYETHLKKYQEARALQNSSALDNEGGVEWRRGGKDVFVGLLHLGCCRMCSKEKLSGRWRALVEAVLNTSLVELGRRRGAGVVRELP